MQIDLTKEEIEWSELVFHEYLDAGSQRWSEEDQKKIRSIHDKLSRALEDLKVNEHS